MNQTQHPLTLEQAKDTSRLLPHDGQPYPRPGKERPVTIYSNIATRIVTVAYLENTGDSLIITTRQSDK